MNVTSKDFTAQFKGIKAEVLAMKQAHEYGLNRTNFELRYIEEYVSDSAASFRLTITFDTKSSSQPYIQINSYDFDYAEIYLYTWTWDAINKAIIITGLYGNFHYVSHPETEIALVSAVPIKNIVWEET